MRIFSKFGFYYEICCTNYETVNQKIEISENQILKSYIISSSKIAIDNFEFLLSKENVRIRNNILN